MTELRVMTFNVRGCIHEDGVNVWPSRADLNVRTIEHYAPDLLGLQEFQEGNGRTYEEQLRGYELCLGGTTGNFKPYEYNPILWSPSRLELLDSGSFWLSPTPSAYSLGWGARVVRGATWARFRLRDGGAELLHLNTHLDHISEDARLAGARLIVDQLPELTQGGLAAVITGDFNDNTVPLPPDPPVLSAYSSSCYRYFIEHGLTDAYLAAGNEDGEGSNTFHGFAGEEYMPQRHHLARRLDWILIKEGDVPLGVRSCEIIRDAEPPLYPSDHYPVLATLAFDKP